MMSKEDAENKEGAERIVLPKCYASFEVVKATGKIGASGRPYAMCEVVLITGPYKGTKLYWFWARRDLYLDALCDFLGLPTEFTDVPKCVGHKYRGAIQQREYQGKIYNTIHPTATYHPEE